MAYQSPARIPNCHPERKHKAHGKCAECYDHDFKRTEKAIIKHRIDVRRASLKRLYNMSENNYDEMLIKQNGVCAICGKEEKNQRLAVDHNHTTKQVRGLLCISCNRALGYFENPEWRTQAERYLTSVTEPPKPAEEEKYIAGACTCPIERWSARFGDHEMDCPSYQAGNLPDVAATVMRENLWELYDDEINH